MLLSRKALQLFSRSLAQAPTPPCSIKLALCVPAACYAKTFEVNNMFDSFPELEKFLAKEIIEAKGQFTAAVSFKTPGASFTNLAAVRPGLHTAEMDRIVLAEQGSNRLLNSLARNIFMCNPQLSGLILPNGPHVLQVLPATPEQAKKLAETPESAIRDFALYEYKGHNRLAC